MAAKEETPPKTVSLGRGGTSRTRTFTTEEYQSLPSELKLNLHNVISAIPWGDTHDVVAAYKNWKEAHPGISDEQALSDFQNEASTAPPETFLRQYNVPTVAPQTYAGQKETAQALAGGAVDTAPTFGGSYNLRDASGNFNAAEGRRLRQAIRRVRDGEATPEDQSITAELDRKYGGHTPDHARKALRELDTALAGGAASKAIGTFAPAAYNVARITNADQQIAGLSKPNQAPQAPAPPRRDMGLASTIGTVQQNANTGYSQMERRKLEEQNARNFAGAANRIQNTGDSSNIGANIGALYGQQQQSGVQQALGSEQARHQNIAELASLLGQQRQQENAIQQFGVNQYNTNLGQYNMAEANRRSDLQGAQQQRWAGINQLAQQAMTAGAGAGGGGQYPWGLWNSNQTIKEQQKGRQAVLDSNGATQPQAQPQGVYAPQHTPPNPMRPYPYNGGPYAPGPQPIQPRPLFRPTTAYPAGY